MRHRILVVVLSLLTLAPLSIQAQQQRKKVARRQRQDEVLHQYWFQILMGRTAKKDNTVPGMNELWERICLLQGTELHTSGRGSRPGKPFTYRVKGNEISISTKEKTVTWSSVQKAWLTVQAIAHEQGCEKPIIKGPKQLGVFGASYLYPIFLRLEVCRL